MELSKEEIKINRLLKKIEKLKKQRDHYKERCQLYTKICELHPSLITRHESYEDMVKERQRVKQLEARASEQAKLIALMEKQKS